MEDDRDTRSRTGSAGDSARRVEVRGDGIRVDRNVGDVSVREARHRFGGVDLPATLAGMLAALGTALVLGGLLGAALGAFGYQTGLEDDAERVTVAGLAAGFATLIVAFLVGGWVAGRIARYDGGRNGLLAAVWMVVLAAVLGGIGGWLGQKYDVFRNVRLPQWFRGDALTVAAFITSVAGIALMLLAGWLGGRWGERYHRKADAVILATRSGGISGSSAGSALEGVPVRGGGGR